MLSKIFQHLTAHRSCEADRMPSGASELSVQLEVKFEVDQRLQRWKHQMVNHIMFIGNMDAGALMVSPAIYSIFFISEMVTTLNMVLPSFSFNLLGNSLEDIPRSMCPR